MKDWIGLDWIGLVSFFSRSPPDMELLQFPRWGRLLALAVLGIISVALVARAQDRPKIEVVPQVSPSGEPFNYPQVADRVATCGCDFS